jgi:HEAT repeat protein
MGDARAVQPLVTALSTDKVGLLRKAALGALERIGPSAADALTEELKQQTPYAKEEIVKTLGTFGKAGLKGLTAALADTEARVKVAAISALGTVQDLAAGILLAKTLQEAPDQVLRQRAADAIGRRSHDNDIVAPLMEALHNDPSIDVRIAAVRALGQLKNRAGLREALKHPDLVICAYAGKSLVSMGWKPENDGERGLLALPELLADLPLMLKGPHVQFQWDDQAMKSQEEAQLRHTIDVINQLGRIGDRRAKKLLTSALEHKTDAVRQAAAHALGAIQA